MGEAKQKGICTSEATACLVNNKYPIRKFTIPTARGEDSAKPSYLFYYSIFRPRNGFGKNSPTYASLPRMRDRLTMPGLNCSYEVAKAWYLNSICVLASHFHRSIQLLIFSCACYLSVVYCRPHECTPSPTRNTVPSQSMCVQNMKSLFEMPWEVHKSA